MDVVKTSIRTRTELCVVLSLSSKHGNTSIKKQREEDICCGKGGEIKFTRQLVPVRQQYISQSVGKFLFFLGINGFTRSIISSWGRKW